jgi:hypothetical protein
VIAKSVADLHSPSNNIDIETALNEKGQPINGRGQDPNRHDILTGSDPQGLTRRPAGTRRATTGRAAPTTVRRLSAITIGPGSTSSGVHCRGIPRMARVAVARRIFPSRAEMGCSTALLLTESFDDRCTRTARLGPPRDSVKRPDSLPARGVDTTVPCAAVAAAAGCVSSW